ncbi:MAG: zinc carboxypeptidase, partial [Phycisphaeraceae bacterium]|nr:zinc carboxypeptidase [Phycisphaeraceae bacterium]
MRLSAEQHETLLSRGFVTRIVDHDVYDLDDAPLTRDRNFLSAWMTASEVHSALTGFASTYPSIASLSSIGTTLAGRDIWALKISDNVGVDESEPEVLITGIHHAREVITPITNIALADSLLTNYGSDPQYTSWVDDLEIWIVPIINRDGYDYVENTDIWWRKTRRNNGGGDYGVDPNRNYNYEWGHDDNGSSPDPDSETYRGPAPGSELCILAMNSFVNSRDFVFALNFHSHGELLLWGPSWKPGFGEQQDVFTGYGDLATASNGYYAGNTGMGAIYTVNGGSDDWMHLAAGHSPIYAMTPEIGTAFHPSAGEIPGQVVEGLELV